MALADLYCPLALFTIPLSLDLPSAIAHAAHHAPQNLNAIHILDDRGSTLELTLDGVERSVAQLDGTMAPTIARWIKTPKTGVPTIETIVVVPGAKGPIESSRYFRGEQMCVELRCATASCVRVFSLT